ncbi:MAG: hypothetical protein A3J83_07695 [Elusimicrobia bacterium RIFOXYA2_FULL_40_6]|nr:MAG: hypothetical protein A3J83_07695 [Elusimicrobia bacterium RIFOXYA2_FULL_40_6]
MKKNKLIFLLIFFFLSVLELYSQTGKKQIAEQTYQIPGMIYISSGEFLMGTEDGFDYETPKRKVFLPAFFIDKYEVTNSQFKRFVDSTLRTPPAHWKGGSFPKGEENYPVSSIAYYDALAYAKWAGKRLPTEEEWEKAARGSDARIYPWGNDWEKKYANVRPMLGFGKPKPVGSCPEGASKDGVCDLCGNVWEWTTSWFQPYPGNTKPDPNYGEKFKVIRGGSYRQSEVIAQTVRRDFLDPNALRIDVGFRCVK